MRACEIEAPELPARTLIPGHEPRVFYVDGAFAFENEVGFLPLTWRWDPKELNPGVHHLTVNLRGYEGQFGFATLPVVRAAPKS